MYAFKHDSIASRNQNSNIPLPCDLVWDPFAFKTLQVIKVKYGPSPNTHNNWIWVKQVGLGLRFKLSWDYMSPSYFILTDLCYWARHMESNGNKRGKERIKLEWARRDNEGVCSYTLSSMFIVWCLMYVWPIDLKHSKLIERGRAWLQLSRLTLVLVGWKYVVCVELGLECVLLR